MASDRSISVRVVGISDLNHAFKQTSDKLPKAMQEKLFSVTNLIVVAAIAKMPRKSGDMAGSVKAKATGRGATITAYGSKAPYGPFIDFGGSVGRGHKRGPNMGSIHRTWMGKPIGSGRYIYPTVSEMRPQTTRAIDDAIRSVAQSAGFEFHGEL